MALRRRLRRWGFADLVDPLGLKLLPAIIPAPRKETLATLLPGVQIVIPAGYPSARSIDLGAYEPALTAFLKSAVCEGMNVVDAGANIGYYSLMLSAFVGSSGSVYAFEPDPGAYACLCVNIQRNNAGNIRPFRMALADSVGTRPFVRDPRGAESYLADVEQSNRTAEVAVTTLDAVWEKQGRPRLALIKMDIEGSEPSALRGMRQLVKLNPTLTLIMEVNRGALARHGVSIGVLSDLISELGFSTGHIVEDRFQPFSLSSGMPIHNATYNVVLLQADPPAPMAGAIASQRRLRGA